MLYSLQASSDKRRTFKTYLISIWYMRCVFACLSQVHLELYVSNGPLGFSIFCWRELSFFLLLFFMLGMFLRGAIFQIITCNWCQKQTILIKCCVSHTFDGFGLFSMIPEKIMCMEYWENKGFRFSLCLILH